MENFRIINTYSFNMTELLSVLTNPDYINYLHDLEKLMTTARNTSLAQTIQLTFTEPSYTFSQDGLQQLLTGLIYPTIKDYTGGTVEGQLVIPYPDTATGASAIIGLFRLTRSTPNTVIYINRETSGGQTPINFGTFAGSSNYVKISRVTVGGQTKYEGICNVTATIGGTPLTGFSWVEQQAI